MVLVAGLLSFIVNPEGGRIAVASCLAFIASGVMDTVIYRMHMKRKFIVRSNISNVAGAFVDSALFPLIAFGAVMPLTTLGQFSAKVAGGLFFAWIICKLTTTETPVQTTGRG